MDTQTLSPTRHHLDDLAVPADVDMLTTVLVNLVFVGRPGADDWVLVDAGIPMQAARIRAAAAARFHNAPPRAILLTHGHFDHVGSLHALLRHWPATPVYAHPLELPYLTGQSAYPPPDPMVGGGMMARTSFLFPKHPYDFRPHIAPLPSDGSVPHLPDWRWVHTPGHTAGHVSFFRESDRTLIAGDAFVTQAQESLLGVLTEEKVIHGPPAYFTPDWESAAASVRALAALNPVLALTGHGRPMANPRLAHDLNWLARNFEQVAVPKVGRYVGHPARTDERGTVWLPPRINDARPMVIGALALATAIGALVYANERRRA
jgi:glyoxylase-like metal-dependent hydrolase (beta-lactamase superfamily II)